MAAIGAPVCFGTAYFALLRAATQFVLEQQAKSQLTELTSQITSVCWDKCIGTPGRTLTAREEACMIDCTKRFLETTKFITTRFAHKSGASVGSSSGGRY
ncbi:hypothetical protein WJX81_007070 [Elliptochloris bilobata]|uniref:Mitochondrial import inner membrane translocase subunit n=1 Tax=Elliptochloris bilobata TaxID=381761 RepID=A0AAW1RLZ2_9CHLO